MKRMNTIIVGFLFTALTLSEIARVQLHTTLGFTLLDGAIACTALFHIFQIIFHKAKIVKSELLVPILFFIGAMLLSLLMNAWWLTMDQVSIASLYIVRWVLYGVVGGFLLAYSKNSKSTMKRAMLISGGMVVILGFVQYLFYKNLANLYYLGRDDHLYRLFSTFLDPNFAGVFLVLFFIFLLSAIWGRKLTLERNILLHYSLIFLTSISIFLTYSRSAYIMFLVGVVVFLILKKKYLYIGVAVVGLILAVMLFSNTAIEGLNPFRTASSNARIESLQNALGIIKDQPLFGVGFNAYRYAQIRYGYRVEETPFPSLSDAGTDNSFVFITATAGILGLVTFLFFLYTLLKRVLKSVSTVENTAFFVSLLALCVGSFFINALFYMPIVFWMWSLYSLTEE